MGEFTKLVEAEPGEAHLLWLDKYRNPTGLVSYPVLFYTRRVMPTTSSTIQHILTNSDIYIKPELERRTLENILGQGLLTAEGDLHKRQRKVLSPAFGTGYVREIVPIFTEKADHLVAILEAQLNSQKAEGIEVFGLLSRCTLDIIGSAGEVLFRLPAHNLGFGYEFNTLQTPNDAFAKAYTIILQQLDISRKFNIATAYLPFLLKLPFPRVLEASAARKLIVEYARSLVQDKEGTRRAGKDILSLMVAENEKAAGTLAEMDLVDQCLTFLLAGHETTSTAVIFSSETHN